MGAHFTFNYDTSLFRINEKLLQRRASWLMRQNRVSDYDVSVLFVDDEEISWLNSNYRDKQGPTNVLSFPFSSGNDQIDIPYVASVKELGDIIISVETAQREAVELDVSLHDRLTWLLTHGLLHLLGYDHERSEDEAFAMWELEKKLISQLHNSRSSQMTNLAINVDHVATVRNARGITEPDPVAAAAICELAGAAGIVVHLREDRRHINDRDVRLLRETIKTRMNLEMGANKEIIEIAISLKPDMVTLVPEKRQELTTEGGLDVVGQKKKLAKTIKRMDNAGIPVSLFIDPDVKQVKAAHSIGATYVEIHTGRYCDATTETDREKEYQLIATAAEEAYQMGLRVNAGHGLDYQTTARIAALDTIEELSIGHAIIARAVFVGLDQAVREMKQIVHDASMIY
ncbi:pyridoxine 5''-phosphate synthase [Desulfocapsa sulfexigens DSM 10523]|uniref:Multifunctional fusion protein n=1 Tax=Desulfocapsa sulfexigens (strain DSM 10523 / SB164P1) TaxID=1167006 RepID=M1PI77_DESSD|nr:pyridoxine 5'-phosphate synthase [Desulfocapsa sulfexigens]AGF79300.1 pyridoxine 5''-phosphate synthase [Desulfocapsa sulfexigens DSM 10523]